MFKQLSKLMVKKATYKGIISSEKAEENVYGLNAFLTLLLNILTAALIGMIFQMFWEIVAFITAFKTLRKYVGGSHEDTALKCYISSCILYVVALGIIKYYPFTALTTTIGMVCNAVILIIVAPVEAVKKPLDEIETKVFKFRSRVTILFTLCIFTALHYIPNTYCYYYSIVVAVSTTFVMIFAIEGKIKLNRAKKQAVIL